MGTRWSGTTSVNYLGSTMFRLSLLLVIGLTAYVHATDFTCETPTPCEKVPGAVECSADCSCTDNVADQCSRPHPTTAVHVDTMKTVWPTVRCLLWKIAANSSSSTTTTSTRTASSEDKLCGAQHLIPVWEFGGAVTAMTA